MNTDYDDLKYDAFISYRHATLDTEIAEKLHKLLETTKPPKGVKKIKRVFRDKDELPTSSNLADSILDALKNSRYLIVICSPRTPLSQWVIKEIETFRALHGNDRILALLIEGEPQEAFPQELVLVDNLPVEPLAADIRGKDLKTMKKNLKVELLRMLAPIYGCSFYDLKQRHRVRKIKRIATVLACITIFSLFFGSFSLRQALLLKEKTEKLEQSEKQLVQSNDNLILTNDSLGSANNQLETQNETLEIQMNKILIGQSKYISNEALALTEAGDRRTAILIANQALPSDFNNLDRPYVAEAEFALFNAVKPYNVGLNFFGDFYAHHSAGIINMRLSPDSKYVVSQTNDDYIYVWDIETQAILFKEKFSTYSSSRGVEFVPNTTELIYVSETGLQQVDFLTGQVIWNNTIDVTAFVTHFQQGIIIANDYSSVYIFDVESGVLLESQPLDLWLKDAAFNESGTKFISLNNDSEVLVFDVNKENDNILTALLNVKPVYERFINYSISKDGKTIVVTSNDYSDIDGYTVDKGSLKIYDVELKTEIATKSSDRGSFMMPIFNQKNQNIIHWYSDTIIHTYDIELAEELPSMSHGDGITQMKTSSNSPLLMASAYDGTIRTFNIETGNELNYRFILPGSVEDFDILQDVLITVDFYEEDLLVWKNSESPIINRFDYKTTISQGFYIGDDHCITISYDEEVSLWNTRNQEHVKVIKQYDTLIMGQYIKNNNTFIILTEDGIVTTYDSITFEEIQEIQLEDYSHYNTVISNKGYLAYVDSATSSVIVYDSNLVQIQ